MLIITEKETNEKDSLVTRKQLHCLSCDKELDKLTGLPNLITYRYKGWKNLDKMDLTMRSSLQRFKSVFNDE